MKEIFLLRDVVPYQLRKQTNFKISSVHSVVNGTESIKFLRPKLWEISPHEIKQFENLKEFNKAIQQWEPASCPCRLYKTYIHKLGFIWYSVPDICFSFYHYLLFSNYLLHFCLRIVDMTRLYCFVDVN